MDKEIEDTVDTEQLALDFLSGNESEKPAVEPEVSNDDANEGHAAWKAILDEVPEEYHAALRPTLQEWDTGVSRQFQKIHDKYSPLEELANEYDPDTVREALNIYDQLVNDPAATYETIGRVFDLSPQVVQTGLSDISEEEFDGLELPNEVLEKLAQVDEMSKVLGLVTQELNQRRDMEEEAEGEQELDDYLEELEEEYGEFDADYVVALIGAGIDGDEAVERFQELVGSTGSSKEEVTSSREKAPKIMSSSGGVPSSPSGLPDLTGLSSRNTKDLVTEILRLNAQNNPD